MRRREFLGVLGGAAAAWPVVARGQGQRLRRIGVLENLTSGDPESSVRVAAFAQALALLGWTPGRDVQIDYRWGAGSMERFLKYADELVALGPDVILAVGAAAVGPLLQASRTVPIVFVNVTDPVGAGFVASLARPNGNATGFTLFEYGISAKWLELLKQIAPQVTRVAVLRDSTLIPSLSQFAAMQTAAQSIGVELHPIDTRDPAEIESGIAGRALQSNSGLVVVTGSSGIIHRELIIRLAAQHQIPAVYHRRYFATAGGLLSYGPPDQLRQAASYVDRILKGEKPADLPVQAPTKYELVINLKTAKSLGLTVATTLLATADEVIE